MTTKHPYLDNLPRRHEREALVAKAETDIAVAVGDRALAHQLTIAELTEVLGRLTVRWAQRQVQHERGERRTTDEDA